MPTYSAMNIIVLPFLIKLARYSFPVDHAASHRYSLSHDAFNQIWPIRSLHGVDTSFGECQINGLCEIQWCCWGITQICHMLGIPSPRDILCSIQKWENQSIELKTNQSNDLELAAAVWRASREIILHDTRWQIGGLRSMKCWWVVGASWKITSNR